MSRPSAWLPAALAFLCAAIVLAWWLPNRPRAGDVAMADARFNAVSFAPFRAGQSPLTETFPSVAEVEADVARLSGRVRTLRTYAATDGGYDVAEIAGRHGLRVWQGIWLGADRARNAAEIARGIALAHAHPNTIARVVVGNEVLLRRDLPVDELIAAIDQVRAAVAQPVTYADVWEFWERFPEVAPHVDIVTIHLLPYWEDHPTGIADAVSHVSATYRRIAARFPGKPVAIGETGWPSRGRARADAVPGVVNQAVFLRQFIAAAAREGFDYNLIEAFDQGWKYRNEGVVGANWGLDTQARAAKFPLAGGVVENPRWPLSAFFSCLLTLALLALALPTGSWGNGGWRNGLPRSSHSAGGQMRLAGLAAALGTALAFAESAVGPDLLDAYSRIAGVGNLAAQTVLAVLLMGRAASLLAGETMPRARTGADATRALRGVLRFTAADLARSRGGLLEDLSFLFLWTAALLQLLLLFDPRYRDFPLPAFAVPLVAVAARALLADLPTEGGGRAEAWAGGVLAVAALAGAVQEGWLNRQSVAWAAGALMLAAPALLRCRRA